MASSESNGGQGKLITSKERTEHEHAFLMAEPDHLGQEVVLQSRLFRHEAVVSRMKREISQNLEEASVNLLIGSKAVIEMSDSAKDPSAAIKRRMASTMGKVVEEALYLSFDRGDTRLMEEITRLLAGHGGSKE